MLGCWPEADPAQTGFAALGSPCSAVAILFSGRNPSPGGLSMLGCWPEADPAQTGRYFS